MEVLRFQNGWNFRSILVPGLLSISYNILYAKPRVFLILCSNRSSLVFSLFLQSLTTTRRGQFQIVCITLFVREKGQYLHYINATRVIMWVVNVNINLKQYALETLTSLLLFIRTPSPLTLTLEVVAVYITCIIVDEQRYVSNIIIQYNDLYARGHIKYKIYMFHFRCVISILI